MPLFRYQSPPTPRSLPGPNPRLPNLNHHRFRLAHFHPTVLNDVNELRRVQPRSLQEYRLGLGFVNREDAKTRVRLRCRSLQVQGRGERRLEKEREGYADHSVTILIVKAAKGVMVQIGRADGKDDDQDLRAVNIVGLWPTPCVSLAAAATQRTGIINPTD
ncbi:hypothetical protein BKA70DRAFT_1573905 [Coprinopsis sp. MPI-PUGE-AT-0042]|nr:hypothetical protein BKA70DRAFT_1573905 [Coprinopsis sp. MPI-PUGE-AT-0042]